MNHCIDETELQKDDLNRYEPFTIAVRQILDIFSKSFDRPELRCFVYRKEEKEKIVEMLSQLADEEGLKEVKLVESREYETLKGRQNYLEKRKINNFRTQNTVLYYEQGKYDVRGLNCWMDVMGGKAISLNVIGDLAIIKAISNPAIRSQILECR